MPSHLQNNSQNPNKSSMPFCTVLLHLLDSYLMLLPRTRHDSYQSNKATSPTWLQTGSLVKIRNLESRGMHQAGFGKYGKSCEKSKTSEVQEHAEICSKQDGPLRRVP